MNFPTPINLTPYRTIDSTAKQSGQCGLTESANLVSSSGFLFLLLGIGCGYLCFGRWQRKQGEQQAIAHRRQQIESLERIWSLTTHPEP